MRPLTKGSVAIERMPQECYFAIAGNVLADAIKSFQAGAYRASIQMLWIAVTVDAVWRIEHLAAEGDGQAKPYNDSIVAISEAIHKRASGSIQKAQAFEAEIPNTLLALEQISWTGAEALERLKRDRNLAAHMSFDWSFDAFELNEDSVRAHLRNTFDTLLSQPPVAGRRAVEAVLRAAKEKSFPSNPVVAGRILNGIWFDNPRPVLLRALLDKIIFSDELKEQHRPAALVLAKCIQLIDKELYYKHLAEKVSKYAPGATDDVLRWLFLLTIIDLDAYDSISEAARERFWSYLRSSPPDLLPEVAERLSKSDSHQSLLEPLFRKASLDELIEVGHIYDNPVILRYGLARYSQARNWNEANIIYDTTISPNIDHITIEDIRKLAQAAKRDADLVGSHSFTALLSGSTERLNEHGEEIGEIVETLGLTHLISVSKPAE